jgi:hypothetical protein
VHPHDQHVLVVGAVEDDHLPLGRGMLMGPPQEVVGGLEAARLLEADGDCPLGIHAAEEVAHHPVLAARIERLQDHEQGLVPVGIEQVLKPVHARDLLRDLGQRRLVRPVLALEAGIDLVQVDF